MTAEAIPQGPLVLITPANLIIGGILITLIPPVLDAYNSPFAITDIDGWIRNGGFTSHAPTIWDYIFTSEPWDPSDSTPYDELTREKKISFHEWQIRQMENSLNRSGNEGYKQEILEAIEVEKNAIVSLKNGGPGYIDRTRLH